MIIVRTPLRISIAGGGTDLPSYYTKFGSTFISAAIDKYIYITYHRSQFDSRIRLRYSRMEEVDNINDIQNEIIRETFRLHNINKNVELTSHAEIPSGTGLGSSGSFGVGILHAIYPDAIEEWLAKESTRIQMNILGNPIGVQDQYVSAYGGVKVYKVDKNGNVLFKDINMPEDNLALFFTGIKRDANEVLKNQKENPEQMEQTLHKTQELCYNTIKAFEMGDFDAYGEILNEHWQEKKKRSPIMTNSKIDEMYNLALKNGAIGGKLVGAGGGGFLLFYTKDKEKLINTLPLLHIPFGFDFEGSRVLIERD